jgi:hypothetical protein
MATTGLLVLPGRSDERGGGAGLSRADLDERSESWICTTGRRVIGERVVRRAGESGASGIKDMGGVEEDTKDDADFGVCEPEMEGSREGAWKVAETMQVSWVWGS